MTELFRGGGETGHRHSEGAYSLLARFRCSDPDRTQQGGLISLELPILKQLKSLRPSEYLVWIESPVTGQPRFFTASWAESLTKVKWWVVPVVWLPIASACITAAFHQFSIIMACFLCLFGLLTWQFIEYSFHRFLFHWEPRSSITIFLHFLFHGCHHKFPMDVDRLVFPPFPASCVAALLYGMLRVFFSKDEALVVFAGLVLGYVAYDCTHYFIHSGSIKSGISKNHMRHHFDDSGSNFGITSSVLDAFFGTAAPKLAGNNAAR